MSVASTERKSKQKPGETCTLQIEELSSKGDGVGLLEGRPVIVSNSLPGDQVQVRLTRVRSQELEAVLLQVISNSPDRVTPRCAHFGLCGGCSLQSLSYPAQVEWKKRTLEKILREQGGFSSLPPIEVTHMEEPWGYRSKMEFSFGQGEKGIILGLHQRSSFQRIVDIDHCHIAPPFVSELLKQIKDIVNQFPLKAYDPRFHQGFWRYAVIRTSLSLKTMMLLLVTNEGPAEPLQHLARELSRRLPALKSIYWGVSAKVSDVAQPDRTTLLWGEEVLEDRLGDVRFHIHPTNFVQPNLHLAAQIYQAIQKQVLLSGARVVYDLYCGIGLIALSAASHVQMVYGVESEPGNIACAQRNAELNQSTNAIFMCGKVEDLVKERALFKAGLKPDLIIMDPPRVGLHKEVIAPVLDAQVPVLLYLSCNPDSLAKDLKIICERDPRYHLESVHLFDFFPHTAHMEALVALHHR